MSGKFGDKSANLFKKVLDPLSLKKSNINVESIVFIVSKTIIKYNI
jgi:hypothetical protein